MIETIIDNSIIRNGDDLSGGEVIKKFSVEGGNVYIYTSNIIDAHGCPIFTETCFVPFKERARITL